MPIQTTVTVKKRLAGDVNGDNQVDLFDLVQVASMFGKKGKSLAADISGDGQVDLFDLVQVASNFGKSNVAAAPAVLTNKLTFTTQQSYSGIGRYPSAFRSRRTGTQLVDSYPNLRDYRNKLLGVDEVWEFYLVEQCQFVIPPVFSNVRIQVFIT